MAGGLESRCVGRVYGADGAVRAILLALYALHFVRYYTVLPCSGSLSPRHGASSGCG